MSKRDQHHLMAIASLTTKHRCDRRAIDQLAQRGDMLVQKLYHGCRRRNRADSPLSSRRSAWF